MAETQTIQFEELHDRTNDGIHVSLLMRAVEPPEFRVDVNDFKKSESFSVPVREGQRPMEVFTHPFAYVGTRAVEASIQPAMVQEAVYSD
jgi:hypothetical protein